MKRAFSEKEAAHYCGVSESYFRKLRADAQRGGTVEGPAWVRLGPSRIRYMLEALDEWLNRTAVPLGACEGKRTSTSGAEAMRRHSEVKGTA